MVSLLMPFKDTEAYLPACLDSILNQTYMDWELLAVDDGSSDSSRSILETYAQSDSRIRVFMNAESGIIPALRVAYKYSSGNYISRMDSDDIMEPAKLETMINSLQEQGEGHVALGLVKYFSEDGISDGYYRYEKWLNQLTSKGTNYSEIYKECVIPSPCWMVSRSDLDRCGAFESNRYPEDYDLTFRFYKHQLKCIPSDSLLHHWRDYPHRTSRTSEHYAQNYFLDIKVHYFLELDFQKHRPLVIWGAGSKGKTVARLLIKEGRPFTWLCDNPKKIGKKIYGQELVPFQHLESLKRPQSIVTVANEEAQAEIRAYFKKLGHTADSDCFFFC